MAYAQTNYSQLQGMTVSGVHPRYPISAIGCFITSFCNLEARFGKPIAPDDLDNALAAKKLYIDVDDGVYDDVSWSTITAYDPTISVSRTGSGLPPSSNCIVKFIYNSFQTGRPTTHFCLVNDARAGTIIDSWDGQVKSWNAYPGGPKAWAEYVKNNPQPVTPAQGDNMAMTPDFVKKMYEYVAGREPSASEVNFQATNGNPASLLNAFITNGDLATKRLGAQITTLQSQLDQVNKSLTSLQAQADTASKQLAQVTEDNDTLKQANSDLTSKLSDTQKAVDSLTKTNQKLAAQTGSGNGPITVQQALETLIQAVQTWLKKGV